MEDPMIETFMDKIKSSALKSMKRIGDQSRRFQEIVYGKSLETFNMRDSIRKKHL
jgi:hypothetical protein